MWEKIKSHPWIIGGAVGLLLLVLLFSSSSSNSQNTSATGTTVDPNADALTAALAQTQAQGQLASLQASSQAQQTQAALQATQIAADVQTNANTLAAQVAEFNTSAGAQTQQLRDTLSAQVAENTNATTEALATTQSNTIIQQAQINAGTQNQLIQALQSVQLGQIGVESQQVQASKDVATQSWFSKIFG